MPHASSRNIQRLGVRAFGGTAVRADTSIESRIGRHITPQTDGCWIYNSKPDTYGRIDLRNSARGGQRPIQAHRYVYETLVGEIPEDHHLHHICQVKGCVNPDHLMVVTPAEHANIHAELRRKTA